MLAVGGQFYLLFSGGIYTSSSYAQGYAVCATPDQPVHPDRSQPDPVVLRHGRRSRRGLVVPGRVG